MSTSLPALAPASDLSPDLRRLVESTRPIAPRCRRCGRSGVDEVIRKTLALLAANGACGSCFRATPSGWGRRSFPNSGTSTTMAVTTFDWPTVPELYVLPDAVLHAGAYGIVTSRSS